MGCSFCLQPGHPVHCYSRFFQVGRGLSRHLSRHLSTNRSYNHCIYLTTAIPLGRTKDRFVRQISKRFNSRFASGKISSVVSELPARPQLHLHSFHPHVLVFRQNNGSIQNTFNTVVASLMSKGALRIKPRWIQLIQCTTFL